jgi:predicted dehydrogenase
MDPYQQGAAVAVRQKGGEWLGDLEALLAWAPDLCVVATPHDTAVDLTLRLLRCGFTVLMEKPCGRSAAEASKLADAAGPARLYVGFNYRFFPGVAQLIADAQGGRFGKLVSVTFTLGHGGAPGMEQGWKFDPVRAGGGCLIDPGIHLMDLIGLLFERRSIDVVGGTAWSGAWNTGIEEEVRLLLRAGETAIALDLSVVRWRSVFRIEVHGDTGYGVVTGRGRSYGPQQYVRGRKWGWQNASSQAASEETVSVSDCAESFREELRAILFPSGLSLPLAPCTTEAAVFAMELYEQCKSRVTSLRT